MRGAEGGIVSKPQAMHDLGPYGPPSTSTTTVAPQGRQAGAGWVVFAAVMMIMSGSFNAIEGLVALLNAKWLAANSVLPVRVDYTAWGWAWLLFGIVVAAAGVGALRWQLWARIVGVVAAALNAIAQLLFIPAYPFWAIAVIAVDIIVIWALTTHGDELTA
jgi:hypothetical protein